MNSGAGSSVPSQSLTSTGGNRLDSAPWRPIHTRIALALGVGWGLDAFEVSIINSVITPLAADFGIGDTGKYVAYIVWFVGIGLGAMVFGYLADRVGRRRLFVATLIFYSVAAMLSALAPTFEVFAVFRFLTGLGVGGEYAAVASAMAEFLPARNRGRTNAIVMNFWAVGGITAGLVGVLFLSGFVSEGEASWRYALLFGAVSALFALFARRLIPESPRWLAARGRLAEANAVVEEISGVGRSELEFDLARPRDSALAQVGELWRHARGRLLFGMALDFSEAAGYYGLFTFTAVIIFERAVSVSAATIPWFFVVANFGALAGGLLVSWTLDRFGRKPTVFFSYLSAASAVLVLTAAASSGDPTLTAAALTLAVFCATCSWVSAYPTFSELFPTHLRATGVGVSVATGRVGAILGNVVLALVGASFGVVSAGLVIAALWLIGAVAAALWWVRGVEGRGVELETLSPARPATAASR